MKWFVSKNKNIRMLWLIWIDTCELKVGCSKIMTIYYVHYNEGKKEREEEGQWKETDRKTDKQEVDRLIDVNTKTANSTFMSNQK